MKKLLVLLFVVSLPLFFSGCGNVVATVNGQTVTQKELDKELEMANGKTMLDNLITEKLIEQDATAKHVTVSDADIEKQLDEAKKGLSQSDQQSLTGDKLEMLKKQISLNLLLERAIMSAVSAQEMKGYFDKNRDILPEVELAAILVADPKQAVSIENDLRRGVPFTTEAGQFSIDPVGREHGGYVGFISKGNLMAVSPSLAQTAFALTAQQVSPPIKTQKGYYILKIMSRRDSFDDLKDEVEKQMAGQRAQNYLKTLHDGAKIDYKGAYAAK